MTPAEIKKTRLYRTLAPCIRKQDREELARMLAMVDWQEADEDEWTSWLGVESTRLVRAFEWGKSPQGHNYWEDLSDRLDQAGHECW